MVTPMRKHTKMSRRLASIRSFTTQRALTQLTSTSGFSCPNSTGRTQMQTGTCGNPWTSCSPGTIPKRDSKFQPTAILMESTTSPRFTAGATLEWVGSTKTWRVSRRAQPAILERTKKEPDKNWRKSTTCAKEWTLKDALGPWAYSRLTILCARVGIISATSLTGASSSSLQTPHVQLFQLTQ